MWNLRLHLQRCCRLWLCLVPRHLSDSEVPRRMILNVLLAVCKGPHTFRAQWRPQRWTPFWIFSCNTNTSSWGVNQTYNAHRRFLFFPFLIKCYNTDFWELRCMQIPWTCWTVSETDKVSNFAQECTGQERRPIQRRAALKSQSSWASEKQHVRIDDSCCAFRILLKIPLEHQICAPTLLSCVITYILSCTMQKHALK